MKVNFDELWYPKSTASAMISKQQTELEKALFSQVWKPPYGYVTYEKAVALNNGD